MMRVISLLLATSLCGAVTSYDQALAQFRAGRFQEARTALQAIVAADGSNNEAKAYLGLAQAASGDCAGALPLLTTAAAESRLTGIAAARCEININDFAHAEARLDDLRKRYPSDADVLYLTAKLHMKAFNSATEAMYAKAPGSYRVHQLSAEIFEANHRFEEAAAEYRQAIAINKSALDLHYRLGRALLLGSRNPGSLDEATKAFQAELALSPEDSASEYQLAQIATLESQPAEAKQHLSAALKISPDFVAALLALGKLESQEKDWPTALRHLERAEQLQPDNETVHYALLTAYRNSGNLAKAKTEKATLDRLGKPPEGEFSEFLRKLGEKQPPQ